MKRIRTIKPEFFTSEDVTALPLAVRLTFIGLWLYADDYGRENARASLVRAAVWPEDDLTTAEIDEHLLRLAESNMIQLYTVADRTYFQITNWAKHQRVDKPSRSNIPEPRDTLATPSRQPEPVDDVPVAMEGRGEGEWGEGEESGSGEPGEERRDIPTPSRRKPNLPPSPFCKTHPEGTVSACRACGNARLKRKVWEDELAAEIDLVEARASVTFTDLDIDDDEGEHDE